ncbi:putative fatty acyl-CoA reductase CG5065 isoform X1 [Apis florea]|uniref:putative fatty acyl-CoA reductase CG5065 isoform X1 n=1 Tax=Apis florea TaxID=7463 RepID=UPI000252C18F|nr:putative fatty acyl-CoA reductase CG5065 isoform X1 [Apis florea]
MASDVPSISEWLQGRNVFITGGSGFMGKVLIYKLLVSCDYLENIFVLIRKKRDVDPQSRMQYMIKENPLKIIKEKYPEKIEKIKLIQGDTTDEHLALSTADKQRLLKEVSVVFHMAANVKFDLTLKQAITINTLGTKNVINLAKKMEHLKSFIHVSTSYCHCNESVLEERNYPAPVELEKIIKMVNDTTDDFQKIMTPKILQGLPNTYALSKALAEDLVQKSGLPAGVARPSIVVASWKEPMPGWIDNMNGPTGLMVGAGKGVIRTVLCNYNYLLNLIPCDMAINAMIGLAWKVGREKPEKPIFMNVTSGLENPISWGYAVEIGRKYTIMYPFTGLLWYPGGSITRLKIYHWIRVILFHYIPAIFIDIIIFLTGNKPFLIRVHQKVNNGIGLIQYYTTKEWEFRNDRMRKLQLELNSSDREKFFMDTKAISWDSFMLKYILGVRQYCLKDDLSTIPRARKVIRYLYFADWFAKIGFTIFLVWFLFLDKFI